jgi:uncharacterized protein (TIGR04255 family)
MPQTTLPDRIDPDAIIEALVEFRFEHAELAEAVVGRLLDASLWAAYSQARLPSADIPQPIKDMDPNLRFLPIIELKKTDGTRAAKIGGHVFSYHILGSYPGWEIFYQEIDEVLNIIAHKLRSPNFSRLGFRYINMFRPEEHHVTGLSETNISVSIGGEKLTDSLNLNYMRKFDTNHTVTVKIATPDLVATTLRTGFPFSAISMWPRKSMCP